MKVLQDYLNGEQAICPVCMRIEPLDDRGNIRQHPITVDKLYMKQVEGILPDCEGVGMNPLGEVKTGREWINTRSYHKPKTRVWSVDSETGEAYILPLWR